MQKLIYEGHTPAGCEEKHRAPVLHLRGITFGHLDQDSLLLKMQILQRNARLEIEKHSVAQNTTG